MLKLNLQSFTTWCKQLIHWKRPWSWERLKAGRKDDDREWDGWMASPTQRTWVWASFRSWWWTGQTAMLQSMGSQRVRHDWVTELNWRGPGQPSPRLNNIPSFTRQTALTGNQTYSLMMIRSWDYKQEHWTAILMSHPRSWCSACDLFPVGTPDVLWQGTSQHWLSLDVS